MGSERDDQSGAGPTGTGRDDPVETETEYLDLDHDGVPDAVQTTAMVEYHTEAGVDVVESIREVDSGIGPDGVPTTVTVSDAIAFETDHDGTPDAAEVIEVTVHPDTEPGSG